MKKTNTFVLSLSLFVISILVCLAIAEGALRLKNLSGENYDIEMWRYSRELKRASADKILGHEHVPSSSAVLQNIEISLNERGLRGAPISLPVPDRRRILVLGSSITLGWGVREEETLTARLTALFAKDGQTVEVLNGGVGNYNTVRYVNWFLSDLTDLKPTDIVVHYFINDAETLDAGGGNFLLRHSQLAVSLWIAANRLLGGGGETSLIDHYKKVYDDSAPSYGAMLVALDKLKDYAKKNQIRVTLSIVPDVHNLTDYPFGFIHTKMAMAAADRGFAFVDLYPGFDGMTPDKIWSMPGDPHPNGVGHEIMAQALFAALRN